MIKGSGLLHLVRVLFPKWSFFDQSGMNFLLEAKASQSREWTQLESSVQKPVGALFHSPLVNLHHAKQNLIVEFLQELTPALEGQQELEPKELETSIVFRQIKAMVATMLIEAGFTRGQFQFRLKDASGDVFFVSHELSMEAL